MTDTRDLQARRAAATALVILTFINMFNYVDRFVVSAVLESLKKSELHPSDTQLGALATGFILVYMATSPVFGTLGDRRKRPPLIALGVAMWSLATALGGLARSFTTLFLARSTVGVGEAAYGSIAPALLSDHYPAEKRGRAFAIFFCAIPIGSAAGYILGGLMDQHFGWRAAFFVAGAPGLLLSLLVLWIKDPPRGGQDAHHVAHTAGRSLVDAYTGLLRNRQYLLAVLGYAAYTFALGGLAYWAPSFLERVRGMSHHDATVTFGLMTVVTGFVGTFGGGWLGDLLLKRTKESYLWVCGVSALVATPFAFVAFTSPNRSLYLPAMALAELFLFMSTGPVNSAIVDLVAANERATAVGLSVFLMHLLGDVPSPPLIGLISDHSSLATAFLLVPAVIAVSGAIWCYAAWRGERVAAQT
jgi:predicted MFS family arabinose efflux permease